ncbi:ABC transporter [Methanobrevibacter sp. YE315]|uniref:ABC transporter permease n=1 Tax=Methanobrevibacter sp. YE315 TaxID=1609968 RepID=UPI000764D665|nr:ABC transporter permease [Methanobrevibacter sp. YE315]AMD18072.1 ABC transporter [Methanobrevibacter sp. YE315]
MSLSNKVNFFLFEEIVKKNFASKYKDSVLGIMWSVLKPLLVMTILTIIFSTVFSRKIENFPVYYLSGKCLFDFFTSGVGVSMNAIRGNKNILERTAAPMNVFVLGGVISEFLNFIISLIILIAVMIVTKAPFHFNTIPLSIIPVISLIMMTIGIGFILSILYVYYTDVKHLWSVVTMILMYASALFYPMEIIGEPYHQYMILNPLFWVIDQFRHFAVWGTIPDLLNIFNSLLLSSIILVLGIIVFKTHKNKVAMKF